MTRPTAHRVARLGAFLVSGARLTRRWTTTADRWVLALTAGAIAVLTMGLNRAPGQQVDIMRDNQRLFNLPLATDTRRTVAGRLGAVDIIVESGRVRLLEYDSPRKIGMRTGWISSAGAMAACVPCGIVLQVTGKDEAQPFDAMTR